MVKLLGSTYPLLTAHHRAQRQGPGIALLDGDWAHRGAQEDADAPRRLSYVAMTRARQTLLLARQTEGSTEAAPAAGRRLATPFSSHGGNRFLSDLPGAEGVLVRDPVPLNPPAPELSPASSPSCAKAKTAATSSGTTPSSATPGK